MQINAAGTMDPLGQAQLIMMRKAMDMALQSNQQLLSVLPAAPAAGSPAPGSGGSVDTYA